MTKKTREPKKLRSFKEMLEMPANDGQASSRPAPPPPPKKKKQIPKAAPENCEKQAAKHYKLLHKVEFYPASFIPPHITLPPAHGSNQPDQLPHSGPLWLVQGELFKLSGFHNLNTFSIFVI